ncbi:hypothetical protein ACXET9_00400 [Brachybacterium sp. DNPG3]
MNESSLAPAAAPAGPESVDDRWLALIDTALKVQAPLARSYVRRLRAKRPDATQEELLRALHRRFTTLATLTGAGIGGTAALPGVGTAVAVGLTVGEGISFAETCAFLTLATAEIHEVDMTDPQTRRLVLMAVLSGERGAEIVARAMGKQGLQWNAVLGGGGVIPSFVSTQVSRYVRKRLVARTGKLWMARLLPFGIGAAIGGFGARAVSRTVIEALDDIFAQAETIEGEVAGQDPAALPS